MLHKLRTNVRDLGAANSAFYALRRAAGKLGGGAAVHRYALVVQPIPPGPLLPPGRARSTVIRPVAPGDPALAAMPLTEDVLRYRFDQGAACFGAFRDGEMVGCLWLRLGPYLEDEVRCRFVPLPAGRSAWDFDVYVVPGLRAGLTFARLWDAANDYLRAQGITRSFSRISVFNAASLASHRRLGARTLGTATFVRLGRWQVMVASLPPYLHLSTRPGAVPEIRLRAPRERDERLATAP